jgi:hypothetical protein
MMSRVSIRIGDREKIPQELNSPCRFTIEMLHRRVEIEKQGRKS